MGRRRQAGSLRRLLLALLLASGCGEGDAPPSQKGDPLNVLLISVDTLRADHLSSYGYKHETSPSIDHLAREGVLFRNAIAQRGGTWPSLTSILTSMYPRTHGVRNNGDRLSASNRILAELLLKRGYETGAFLTNMESAPNRGFEHKPEFPKGDRDEFATAEAIRWIQSRGDAAFFAWLHLLGPHDPYAAPRRLRRRFDTGYRGELDGRRKTLEAIHRERRELSRAELAHIVSLYDADIAQVDLQIAAVLSALEALGLSERTLVVLTSDHGEELYEHNHYFFHSYSIYESVLRVPLIMRLPGVISPRSRVDATVESIDIAPTVLDFLDIPIPDEFEGTSLRDRILAPGAAGAQAGVAISDLGPGIYSIRTDRWHFIYNPRGYTSPIIRPDSRGDLGHFRIEAEELYDVREDPRETRNLVGERRDVAAPLRARLLEWIEGGGEESYRPAPLSPETEAELRALGYLE
ncbi:MAG: sulfatase [Myxococcota bacterium]